MQCRARKAFKSPYGLMRVGNIFTCEPDLAKEYAKLGNVEILPDKIGPDRVQALSTAPRVKAGKELPTENPQPSTNPTMAGLPDDGPDSDVVCIASGPSLTAEDVGFVRGKAKVIVINTSFRLAPWADVLYACDASWWIHYFSEAAGAMGAAEMWTCANRARDQFKLHYIFGAPMKGLSKRADQIHTGFNSGYQAIGLAHLWGAKRILLLGYDFMRTGGRIHWHPDHPRSLGNGGRYEEWVKEMNVLAEDAKAQGREIINCSRKTALRCFPKSTIQEALCPASLAQAS